MRACSAIKRARDRVGHEIRFAHAELRGLCENRSALPTAPKKSIDFIHQVGRQSHAGGIPRDGEKPFPRARVVKALNGRAQTVLRNTNPDLARGDLFERVRFIENDEVIRKEISALAFLLFFGTAEQHEKQRVIDHDHIRGEQSFARLLKKQFEPCPQVFVVQMCASLQTCAQTFGSGSKPRSLSEPSRVLRSPLRNPLQLVLLRPGKELVRLLKRTLEPPWTKVILPPFHKRRIKFHRQNLLQDRDVFVQQLLLQIDRLRRNDRFLLFLRGRTGSTGRDRPAICPRPVPASTTRCRSSSSACATATAISCCSGRNSKFFVFERRPFAEKIVRIRSTKLASRAYPLARSSLQATLCLRQNPSLKLTPRLFRCRWTSRG